MSGTSEKAAIGMVGLGRMGANLVRRLMRDGHPCFVLDRDPDAVAALVAEGATGTTDVAEFVASLPSPKTVWVMVPAGAITDSVVTMLIGMLGTGDCIIDGGNSYYRDDIRAARARPAPPHSVATRANPRPAHPHRPLRTSAPSLLLLSSS